MHSDGNSRPGPHRHLLAIAGPVVVVVMTYAFGLTHPFLFDDREIVEGNPNIRSVSNLGRFFAPTYWRRERPGRSYRPVVEASLALNRAVLGGSPAAFRLVNLALLAGCAVLVYWLAWRLTGRRALAGLASMLFAVHPMHLETVALVKNRSEVLAAGFGLTALLWFLRAARGRGRWWLWHAGSLVAAAAALGSKEVALILPAVLTAAVVFRRETGGIANDRRPTRGFGLALALPLWLLAGAFAVLLLKSMPERYAAAPPPAHAQMVEFAQLGLGGRALVVVKSLGVYLALLVWPFFPKAERAFAIPHHLWRLDVLLSLAAVVAVVVLAVWLCRRRKWTAAFALAWLLLALLPVANVVPNATRPVAEQRLFAATVPFALLVGQGGAALMVALRGRVWRVVLWSLNGAILAAMAFTTWHNLRYWHDEFTFWERAAEQSPTVARARFNYGVLLAQRGLPQASVIHLRAAVDLDDLWVEAKYNLALSLRRLGEREEAERLLRRALELAPDYGPARRALDLLEKGAWFDQPGKRGRGP